MKTSPSSRLIKITASIIDIRLDYSVFYQSKTFYFYYYLTGAVGGQVCESLRSDGISEHEDTEPNNLIRTENDLRVHRKKNLSNLSS
ncbi:CLUMA_CG001678, isoform A [Clunio marinus]|uniref:CLUMA_CG001678, isoform A n=1 Tax=Clunio marinus TaxID=568069 RepID=A0A1J1HIZ7_9DIPT|nr:CLUMA_CG001678, isoform A [Clunio marinus]